MPQIWMTYDELAALVGCSRGDVKLRVNHLSLDRKKSRDGTTRVKLNLALTAKFYEMIKETEYNLDVAIEELHQTYRQMAKMLEKHEAA
jgi:predicted transcriptional regulator